MFCLIWHFLKAPHIFGIFHSYHLGALHGKKWTPQHLFLWFRYSVSGTVTNCSRGTELLELARSKKFLIFYLWRSKLQASWHQLKEHHSELSFQTLCICNATCVEVSKERQSIRVSFVEISWKNKLSNPEYNTSFNVMYSKKQSLSCSIHFIIKRLIKPMNLFYARLEPMIKTSAGHNRD